MDENMSNDSPSKPSLAAKTMVSNAKFKVEKLDETNNFGMWHRKVLDILIQQELDITLEDKPAEMVEEG